MGASTYARPPFSLFRFHLRCGEINLVTRSLQSVGGARSFLCFSARTHCSPREARAAWNNVARFASAHNGVFRFARRATAHRPCLGAAIFFDVVARPDREIEKMMRPKSGFCASGWSKGDREDTHSLEEWKSQPGAEYKCPLLRVGSLITRSRRQNFYCYLNETPIHPIA